MEFGFLLNKILVDQSIDKVLKEPITVKDLLRRNISAVSEFEKKIRVSI